MKPTRCNTCKENKLDYDVPVDSGLSLLAKATDGGPTCLYPAVAETRLVEGLPTGELRPLRSGMLVKSRTVLDLEN